MKYTLIIEGSKEGIEKAKTRYYEIREYDRKGCAKEDLEMVTELDQGEVKFKIVEPKYRVKSLGDLAKEFGQDLTLSTCLQDIVVQSRYHAEIVHLGEAYDSFIEYKYRTTSAEWKKIFLTEVAER